MPSGNGIEKNGAGTDSSIAKEIERNALQEKAYVDPRGKISPLG